MLFIGSLYASSLFSNAIGDPLSSKWATAMGALSLLSAPAMIIAALYLESDDVSAQPDSLIHHKSFRVKVLTAIGGFFFFSFLLASYGVQARNGFSIVIGVTLLGIPLGIFYMLSTALNSVWMHRNPGLGVGLAQGAFGLGTIVFSSVFDKLIRIFGNSSSIWVSGLILGVPTLIAAQVVRWPNQSAALEAEKDVESEQLYSSDESDAGEKIAFSELYHESTFWVYMAIVFCSQTGFALVPFFFEIAFSFGIQQERAVLLFQIANAVGTSWRLLGGVISDALSVRNTRIGSKFLLIILLCAQSLSFGCLAIASVFQFKWSCALFAISSITLFICFAGGACACAVLSRDLYGCNAPTVYGSAAGFATGIGEALATLVVARTLSPVEGPAKYTTPYILLTAASLIGLLCASFAKKSEMVFPGLDTNKNHSGIGNYGSLKLQNGGTLSLA